MATKTPGHVDQTIRTDNSTGKEMFFKTELTLRLFPAPDPVHGRLVVFSMLLSADQPYTLSTQVTDDTANGNQRE